MEPMRTGLYFRRFVRGAKSPGEEPGRCKVVTTAWFKAGFAGVESPAGNQSHFLYRKYQSVRPEQKSISPMANR